MNQLFNMYIVPALFFIVVISFMYGLFYGLNYLRTKSKNSKVAWFAEQAYAFAEKWGKENLSGNDGQTGRDSKGDLKARKAYEVMSYLLSKAKINLTSEQIKYVVELAYHKLEKIPRQQGSTAVINTELVGAEKMLQEAAQKEISKLTK